MTKQKVRLGKNKKRYKNHALSCKLKMINTHAQVLIVYGLNKTKQIHTKEFYAKDILYGETEPQIEIEHVCDKTLDILLNQKQVQFPLNIYIQFRDPQL